MKFPELPGEVAGPAVSFEFHDVEPAQLFAELADDRIAAWLTAVAKTHNRSIAQLDYIFCSDGHLAAMNVEHLDHDTFTDIITFDLTDPEGNGGNVDEADSTGVGHINRRPKRTIEGECYISQDRVMDNANSFGESPSSEMLRVLVHGLLHLCGLGDESDREAAQMRLAESRALENWSDMPTVG